jgi:hypothetical protein
MLAGPSWWYANLCVISDRPTVLHVEWADGINRLHCEDGPAIAWADGWGIYAWHGTQVPADLIETGWDTDRILREENQEVRRCAIERMGWDWFVAEAGLKQVGVTVPDPGNPGQELALYDIPEQIYNEPVRVLLCTNGTAERDGVRRRFGLTVPGLIGDPVGRCGRLDVWAQAVGVQAAGACDMTHIVTEDYTLFVGYDPDTDTEYMLTEWPDGLRQLSTRPGLHQTFLVWSPPVALPKRATS